MTAAEVILSSSWEIESMRIGEVLIRQRDWGDLAIDPHWQVHLEYLLDLQRHGRESLPRTTEEPQHRANRS